MGFQSYNLEELNFANNLNRLRRRSLNHQWELALADYCLVRNGKKTSHFVPGLLVYRNKGNQSVLF
jgi:hypothetical protein